MGIGLDEPNEGLYASLRLPIALRVVGSGEGNFRSHSSEDVFLYLGSELRFSI